MNDIIFSYYQHNMLHVANSFVLVKAPTIVSVGHDNTSVRTQQDLLREVPYIP